MTAHLDDIQILRAVDDYETRHGPGFLAGGQLLELVSGRVTGDQDVAWRFAHELLIAREAGLLSFVDPPPPGWSEPPNPNQNANHWLQACVRDISLTPAGRDRARGRVVFAALHDAAEDDGRAISKMTLLEVAAALDRRYSTRQLADFLTEADLPTPERLFAVGPNGVADSVAGRLVEMLEEGADARRRLRRFIGAWLENRLDTGPDRDEWERITTKLAREGWHVKNAVLVVGERVITPAVPRPPSAGDAPIHPEIWKAIERFFVDGHYSTAIFDALKVVEDRVHEMSGIAESGSRLMGQAFGGDDPPIRLNPGLGQSDKDEQAGFLLIYRGAIEGIRNPKAHRRFEELEKGRALEYLAFVSLLMRRLDDAESLRKASPS